MTNVQTSWLSHSAYDKLIRICIIFPFPCSLPAGSTMNGDRPTTLPIELTSSPSINTSQGTDTTSLDITNNSSVFKTAKIVFYFLILVLSTFGNGMLIYIICSTRKMRTATNYLIFNLAVCDFLTPIFSIPFDFALEENNYKWFYRGFMCKFIYPAATFTVTSSALSLAIISLDRYRIIMHPYKTRLTSKQILYSIGGLNVFSAGCVAPYSYVLRLDGDQCREVWGKFAYRQAYTACLFLVQYALPLLFMAVMYALALVNLYHSSGRTQKMRSSNPLKTVRINNNNAKSWKNTTTKPRPLLRSVSFRNKSLFQERTNANIRATKMFITVVIVFAIFMLPNQVVWLWSDFGGGHKSSSFGKIVIICWLFTYANCVSNPIIFALFSPDFRHGFLKLCKKSNTSYFSSSGSFNRGNSTRRSPSTNDKKTQITKLASIREVTGHTSNVTYYKATTYC